MFNFLTLVVAIFIFSATCSYPQSANILQQTDKQFFIENKGQWPDEVRYLAKVGGMNAWITDYGVVYDYYQILRNYGTSETRLMHRHERDAFERKKTSVKGLVVKMIYGDSNPNPDDYPKGKLDAFHNYFYGNEPTQWATFVELYKEVILENIYEGIDIRYYFDDGLIRYDYKVKPGADIRQLQFTVEGVDGLRVNGRGELELQTSLGVIVHGEILAYQKEWYGAKPVVCSFTENAGGSIGIRVFYTDGTKPLIVDPLIYSTFLVAEGYNNITAHEVDQADNVYLTGYNKSALFPVTPGAYDTTLSGNVDTYVTKMNNNGSGLIFSTYLGGSYDDFAYDIVVDNSSNVYITGSTLSDDFPVTQNVFDDGFNGNWDGFVTKFNNSGSALLFSTYIGSSGEDQVQSIYLCDDGSCIITGWTDSQLFPTTPGVFSEIHSGYKDAFLTKLTNNGINLAFSTFIGGTKWDLGYSVDCTTEGVIYVQGITESPDFPVKEGAYHITMEGSEDIFISKFTSDAATLVASTYFGSDMFETASSFALDENGNVYVCGYTTSEHFYTHLGAFDRSYNDNCDGFVSILRSDLTTVNYGTYIGGYVWDEAWTISLETGNIVSVTGYTISDDFPTTHDAFDRVHNEGPDVFFLRLSWNLSRLIYSTFMGGYHSDYGNDVKAGYNENFIISGRTESPNFPTTPGAYRETHNGYKDLFVAAFSLPSYDLKLLSPKGGEQFVPGTTQQITWAHRNLGVIKFHLSTDNGETWKMIGFRAASYGSYDWLIPETLSTECLIRISESYNYASPDFSDSVFSIVNASRVKDPEYGDIPAEYHLSQNYPNPFNPATTIKFGLPEAADVHLTVHNILGEVVAVLVSKQLSPGSYEYNFNAADLPSGIYFYRLQAGDYTETKKMQLLK